MISVNTGKTFSASYGGALYIYVNGSSASFSIINIDGITSNVSMITNGYTYYVGSLSSSTKTYIIQFGNSCELYTSTGYISYTLHRYELIET